ncbi:tRNA pseudouridine synthase A [Psychroflexus gondwanensis]|jgi:tRNA pseudouridine38-40 synthase|uniref:tRNA pseudouridine synthase A n=1 Tax=Psychroflexus gondwanensis ACAM 44 TaxID=1189619 RepID=N1WRC8_9FLAO|nr:tRNA pseudouridine synthase A [Psychroflexus gondwanensis]EMY81530.1 tRNA pseudouridine synthase A TruA [Psychroflexus gondwanensis ACAM 44]TXE21002.1 tRNA pseudouridine synthase A [Psychroflexus gondwanensis]
MQYKRFYYLIQLQYLGFRYHGWQKQPGVLTVEHMLHKTLNFILENQRFKVLAAGRTDAMVSANQTYIELFVYEDELDLETFLDQFNKNLPQDIRALSIEETTADFNIIQHPKIKEYLYFFCLKEKMHPFCAPFMVNFQEDLDIELMKLGARLFEGEHDFYSFTFRPNPETKTEGNIERCELRENDIYTANFFPNQSFVLKVVGEGFKRQQIRLMMGALIDLGRHKMSLEELEKTIDGSHKIKLEHIAQASGLILNKVSLKL